MRILGIETSCDETAIAIVEIKNDQVAILANIVASQIKIHKKYGGVVPSLAAREHQKNLVPILLRALSESKVVNHQLRKGKKNIKKNNPQFAMLDILLVREQELLKQFKKYIVSLETPAIDAIAVTVGPGLEPALWVGINFAKALSQIWNKPLISINHLEGHIYSNWLPPIAISKSESLVANKISNSKVKISKQESTSKNRGWQTIRFPILNLIVSGGHTMLVLMKNHGKYVILGETLDDAAGEAFDKVARMLGLGYPGGPKISALAEEVNGNSPAIGQRRSKSVIKLPRPMIQSKNYNFSFSGLKTAVLYFIRDWEKKNNKKISRNQKMVAVIAQEFQQAVIDVLVAKTIRAARKHHVKSILLSGGVSANKELREQLESMIKPLFPRISYRQPLLKYTGDNAAMIALAGYWRYKKSRQKKRDGQKIKSLKAEGHQTIGSER